VVAVVGREQTLTLRRHLQRLERELRAGGRCLECRERPERVLRFFPQDAHDETSLQEESHDDVGEPCPDCGWAPAVTEIVEVVVENREDEEQGETLERERQPGTTDS
jgi:hypothetical protein